MSVASYFPVMILMDYNLNQHIKLVRILVEDSEDEIYLRELIEESGNKPMFALIQFRIDKIKKLAITKMQFIKSYSLHKENALTELFQHPIEGWHVNRLDKKLLDKEITLESLYNMFQEKYANLGLLLH